MSIRREGGRSTGARHFESSKAAIEANENDFVIQFGAAAMNWPDKVDARPRPTSSHRSRPVTVHRDNRMVEYEPYNTLVSDSAHLYSV